MPDLKFSSYIVQRVIDEIPGVKTYCFAFGIAPFSFEAGQFAVVRLQAGKPIEGSITLSSSPLRRDGFEITVKRTGTFGTTFYDNVQPGSIVGVSRPMGNFHLVRTDKRPICILGRDYAITAARSILQMGKEARTGQTLTLLHEVSTPSQALYHNEFRTTAYASVNRHLFLENGTLDWPSLHAGAITAPALTSILPNYAQHLYYIAGEGTDVRRMRTLVESLGVPSAQLRMEKWSA